MQVVILGILNNKEFLVGLPFVRGISDLYPLDKIHIKKNDISINFQKHCPFVHLLEDPSIEKYDIVIDIRERRVISKTDGPVLFSQEDHIPQHDIDKLLGAIPNHVRRRKIYLKETEKGIRDLSLISDREFDVAIYPFIENKNVDQQIKNCQNFISHLLQMNKNHKVCIVGFEEHGESLKAIREQFKNDVRIQTEACNLEQMFSLLNRSAYVLCGDTFIKHLVQNEDTILIEVVGQNFKTFKDSSYKENNILIRFKKNIETKLVYTYDEIIFNNNSHLLAYIVTAILDEDSEKLQWFAEKYAAITEIFKVKIDGTIGIRHLPIYWSAHNILRVLMETSMRMRATGISSSHLAEEFYFFIHDDSDFSQERILDELGNIQKFLEQVVIFFKKSSDFEKQAKIRNREVNSLWDAIFVSTQEVDEVVCALFFIRQVINVSGQKLLENLPMTVPYYS